MDPVDEDLPGAWGWSENELGMVGTEVLDLALAHLTRQRDEPVFRPPTADRRERWAAAAWPADGIPPGDLLRELAEVARYPFGNGHPRFHAWVNSPPDRAAVLADLVATAMDPSVAGGNQAAVHVERQVLRWLADLVGLPRGAGGLLVSGGSTATLTALAAARHHRAGFDVRTEGLAGGPPLTVYAAAEAHSSVQKAVEVLGLGRRGLRTVGDHRLDPTALRRALDADEKAGDRPIAVVASAGSTNTGAIDPLDDLADLCAERGLWLHVDAAYGAPAALTDRYRDRLAGMGRADSVVVDPHKWLYVPVDAGALLVRDPELLRQAFTLVPPYLPTSGEDELSAGPWLAEYGPEQTRPFRALRVWAALATTGRDGYRRLIDADLDKAEHLRQAVAGRPELELLGGDLSVVVFRYAGPDARTSELVRRLQLGGEHFVAGTTLDGRAAVRACIVNPLTTAADLDALVDGVVRLGETLTREARVDP